MKAKLNDVAETAGVSITTASMVLAGKGRISQETRDKVLRAAETLGYERRTKRLRKQTASFTNIAIFYSIDPEWAFIWHFIRPIIFEIDSILKKEGYNVLILPIHQGMSNEEMMGKVSDAGVGAVFSMHYGNEELFTTLESLGIPVVVVMNNNFQDKFYSVCVDDFQGAYEAGLHLIRLGHRNIAYVSSERPDLPALMSDRFIGFKKSMDEHGLPLHEDHIITFDLSDFKQLYIKIKKLFQCETKPTAFFVLDDDIAVRLVTVLNQLHYRIPDDISIIAPGDVLDYSQSHIPQITTMKINTALMGKISAELMLSRLLHKHDDIHVLKIKQQLSRRGSCVRHSTNGEEENDLTRTSISSI